MKVNEKGSTLAVVLLVILVFSVLGLALLGNVASENKQVNTTESGVQARYLAENGLTYFEADFKNFTSSLTPKLNKTTDLSNYLLNNYLYRYQNFVPVGSASNPDETKIKAEIVPGTGDQGDTIKVTSIGNAHSVEKTLIGYYKPVITIIPPTGQFTGMAMDFSNFSATNIKLFSLASIDLLKLPGNDASYYRVPDDTQVNVNLLGLLGLSIGDADHFKTMETTSVIATRQGTVLGASLLNSGNYSAVTIDLLPFEDDAPTNVLIDGGYQVRNVLGTVNYDYQNINFKGLAVMGNAILQQDLYGTKGLTADDPSIRRFFSFDQGLYVKNSLLVGGSSGGVGNLQLQGDIIVKNNLYIKDVNLIMGNKQDQKAIYVDGDVTIDNACLDDTPDSYEFRLYAQGSITINNGSGCQKNNLVLYSGKGVTINTNNEDMTINGGIIGNITVDNPNKLHFVEDPQFLKNVPLKIKLISQGRSY